ncbi:MAG: ShlB/FhaC/HecB family hemolysin secretion/activation protein [Bacillota bacterium]
MSRLSLIFGAMLMGGAATACAKAPEPVEPLAAPTDSARFPVRGFIIEGNSMVATERILASLRPYLGESQPADALLQAHETVCRLYEEAGYAMVSVELPSTIGLDGIIRLRVREMAVGRVHISGNEHYSNAYFRAALPALQENRSPNFAALARQLFLANDHSGHQVALNFAPGADGTADVDIKVKDLDPMRVAVSADNTGTPATGRSRATLIATHANLWGAGHEATAGLTTSPESPGSVHQYTLSYQLPLPALGDRLQFGYSYSNTDAGRVDNAFYVSGQGSIASLRLQHNLMRTADTRHLLEFGIEDKRYKNTVDYSGTNLGVDVNGRPVSVNYVFGARSGASSIRASVGHVRNIPGGARNDDATYDRSRLGASASWSAWRANADVTVVAVSQWSLHSALETQYASAPLISSEQFGLGGAYSVRGFEEREALGDRGWRLSNEALAPAIAGQHRLLAFVDAGRPYRLNPQPGDTSVATMLSWGLGWRWTLKDSISTSLDWARVVNGTLVTPAGSNAVHISAVWRFI